MTVKELIKELEALLARTEYDDLMVAIYDGTEKIRGTELRRGKVVPIRSVRLSDSDGVLERRFSEEPGDDLALIVTEKGRTELEERKAAAEAGQSE